MTANNTSDFHFEGFGSPNFTQVPDEAFDQLMPLLSGAEWKVLCYIIRRTYGFKKDSDNISLSQMVDGITTHDGKQLDLGTGLSKAAVATAVKSLVERGVINAARNQSPERGFEATTYQLRFRTPLSKNQTRGGPNIGQGLVQKLDIQETGSQETVEQHTDTKSLRYPSEISLSNIRKGTASLNERGDEGNDESPSTTEPTSKGFASAGSVLTKRYQPRRAPAQTEDRQAIAAYLHDFALELGDKAPLKSSVTRAYNLFLESGVGLERFISALHEARSITKERTTVIRGSGKGPKNKVPYFFSVLEDVLGLREHPEAQADDGAADGTVQQGGDITSTNRSQPASSRPAPHRLARKTIGGPLVRVVPLRTSEDL